MHTSDDSDNSSRPGARFRSGVHRDPRGCGNVAAYGNADGSRRRRRPGRTRQLERAAVAPTRRQRHRATAAGRHRAPHRRLRAPLPAAPRDLPRPHRLRRGARRRQPTDPAVDHRRRDREGQHRAHRRPRPPRRRHRDPRRGPVAVAALGLGEHRRRPDLRHAVEGLRPRAGDADLVLHPHADRRARVAAEQRRARSAAGVHRHDVVGHRQPDRRHRDAGGDVRVVVADHAGGVGVAARLHAAGPLDGQARRRAGASRTR